PAWTYRSGQGRSRHWTERIRCRRARRRRDQETPLSYRAKTQTLTVSKNEFPISGHQSRRRGFPLWAKGLNRSRGRRLRLATRRSNRRQLIVTRGAISPLLATIR